MKTSKTILFTTIAVYLTLSFPVHAIEGLLSPFEVEENRRNWEISSLADQIKTPPNLNKEDLFKKLESYIPKQPAQEGRLIILGFGDAADMVNSAGFVVIDTVVKIMQTSNPDIFRRAVQTLFEPELIPYGSFREIEEFLTDTNDYNYRKRLLGSRADIAELDFQKRVILRELARLSPWTIADHETSRFDTVYFLETILKHTAISSPEVAEIAALQLTNVCLEESMGVRLEREHNMPWQPWKDGKPMSAREQHCQTESAKILMESDGKTGEGLDRKLSDLHELMVLPTTKGKWLDHKGKVDRSVVEGRMKSIRGMLDTAFASLS